MKWDMELPNTILQMLGQDRLSRRFVPCNMAVDSVQLEQCVHQFCIAQLGRLTESHCHASLRYFRMSDADHIHRLRELTVELARHSR
jgi:hypothetical protein